MAWGYHVPSTDAADEALARYRAGGLQAVLVDRGLIAADLDGLVAARADAAAAPRADRRPAMAADEGEIDRFGREQASAILAPPFQLRALRRGDPR